MDDRPVIVFSAPLARQLEGDDVRLPSTRVGVRRVRPSTLTARDAFINKRFRKDENGNGQSNVAVATPRPIHVPAIDVVYKVTDENGMERRMTKKEKKELKLRLRKERAEDKKRSKQQQNEESSSAAAGSTVSEAAQTSNGTEEVCLNNYNPVSSAPCADGAKGAESGTHLEVELKSIAPSHDAGVDDSIVAKQKRQYHQIEVSASALEEELADLRGERNGVPPVLLSGPMAKQAFRLGLFNAHNDNDVAAPRETRDEGKSCFLRNVAIDDEMASIWAAAIKNGMKSAEEARSKEDIRPMAYQLVPEVWSRLRPASLCILPTRIGDGKTEKTDLLTFEPDMGKDTNGDVSQMCSEVVKERTRSTNGCLARKKKKEWSFVTIRRLIDPFDRDASLVFSQLHRFTKLHVSCGAKFGCNFLLYDGRREERHSFAGVRVYSCREDKSVENTGKCGGEPIAKKNLPIPSAYDLAGYVRGLNTAGKLALVATVVRSKDSHSPSARVLFVDLALEKILEAPTHQKKGSRKNQCARKEMGKNLAKNRDS